MASNRWIDRTQPQTLYIATVIMYFNAVLSVLNLGGTGPLGLLLVVGPVAAGWGIANQRKWGYWLGVGLTVLALIVTVAFFSPGALITLIFYAALLGLLLHPQSRDYRRTWFR